MKQLILFLTWGFLSTSLMAQFTEDFSDGDFTNNPSWTGDDSIFVVNPAERLQLNATIPGDAYLAAQHGLTQLTEREWRFNLQYDFNPSGSNGGETYLTAANQDLSSSPDGIYFRIGETGSNDPIELIERDGGTETTILSSTAGIVASDFNVSIKIIHRANGDWELYTDLAGGNAFQLDQSANYPTTVGGQYLGFWIEYTSSNVQNFQFDDIYAGPIQVDNTPPELVEATAINDNTLELLFDEGIEQTSGENTANYSVDGGIGAPSLVQRDGVNLALFTATFPTTFTVGDTLTVTVENVEDFAGNTMTSATDDFQFITSQTPDFGDIIVNEFMANESPVVGLPETEFIELYNRSEKYFHLEDWQLLDNNSAGTIQDIWIYPGEYVILVPTSGLSEYPQAMNVTSWASLNNAGDEITLTTPGGIVVDELVYTDEWYGDEDKEDGGWSLERINPELPCSGADNWKASTHPDGGTPGAENAVIDLSPDTENPVVTDVKSTNANIVELTFSEGMDSLSLANATITFDPDLTISARLIESTYPGEMVLIFNDNIPAGVVHQIEIVGAADCSGNPLSFSGEFVLPQAPEKGDLRINEILFNPVTGGSDFVEIANSSDKYLNIKDWALANYDDDTIANFDVINQHFVIAPKSYVALTTDKNHLVTQYPYAVPDQIVELPDLPSYNNDSSTVYWIYDDTVMDRVSYQDEWHFELLQSDDGVSLEKFDPELASNDRNSWHSASETEGFATPGKENSQSIKPGAPQGEISLSSASFSPDNDGVEDALLITYQVNTPNLLGDLVVYDDKGRKLKTLLSDHLLGAEGTVKWDGTTDDGKKASIGPHIIYFTAFDVNNAAVIESKKVVTVAGQL